MVVPRPVVADNERVERAVADAAPNLRYSLSSKATFEHTFAAGHSYDVRYTIGYEMVDKTTGQKIQPLSQ